MQQVLSTDDVPHEFNEIAPAGRGVPQAPQLGDQSQTAQHRKQDIQATFARIWFVPWQALAHGPRSA